ncbi:MAG: DNA-processing protein DprA [Candidatus Chromulinivorax sp.]|nr:DNA-processing protein DprA [Candidatus Chromulinivorax sp.]
MNQRSSDKIILHLSLIPGIGPATIKIIIEQMPSVFALGRLRPDGAEELADLYSMKVPELCELGLTYDRATKIVAGLQDTSILDKELELIAKYNIGWTVLGSPEYSSLLAEIEQPPAVIYYQGQNLFYSDKALAFVGSRKSDAYARVIVDKLVPQLVQDNWIIVSGGALGVDSLTHDQVVRSGGKTIVVLGSGLLNWYPASNSGLFNKVIQSGGMIVSCFSLQTQPIAANFPARNRIIAGLSQGTVVVQAASKSGALITADFALEQGRQVFAVPGSIEHGLHDGCHYLIQQGAKLVTNVHDIVIEFGYGVQSAQDSADKQLSLPMEISTSPISKQDAVILEKLLQPRSTDELLSRLDIPLEDLMQKLFDLSLEGKISQDMMGLWKRI